MGKENNIAKKKNLPEKGKKALLKKKVLMNNPTKAFNQNDHCNCQQILLFVVQFWIKSSFHISVTERKDC